MSRSPEKSKPQYVDLAEMSMSGTLMPSVPIKVCIKYAPPTIMIVYHFENKEEEEYCHIIPLDRRMLESESVEEICNHLYMAEAYYFNPKILKRKQVKRLVKKLKTQTPLHNFIDGDRSPERYSIHSQASGSSLGSGSPIRGRGDNPSRGSSQGAQGQSYLGNIDGLNMPNKRSHARRNGSPPQSKKKVHQDPVPNIEDLTKINKPAAPNRQQANLNYQQKSAFQRRRKFLERKQFLDYQAHNPTEIQNLTDPPQESQFRPQNPLGINKNHMPGAKQLPPLETQGMNQKQQRHVAMQDRMPIDGNSPVGLPAHRGIGMQPTEAPQVSRQSSTSNANTVGFPQNSPIQATHGLHQPADYEEGFQNKQNPYSNQGISGGGQELMQEGEDTNSQQQQYANDQLQPLDPNASQGEEHVSVYMKDNNTLMRRIQIEGDEREFLMDPDGNIFDMQGTFIGTANTNELEEMNEDGNQQQEVDENNGDTIDGANEMMLLEDDDESPAPNMQQQVGRYAEGGGKMDFDYGSQEDAFNSYNVQ